MGGPWFHRDVRIFRDQHHGPIVHYRTRPGNLEASDDGTSGNGFGPAGENHSFLSDFRSSMFITVSLWTTDVWNAMGFSAGVSDPRHSVYFSGRHFVGITLVDFSAYRSAGVVLWNDPDPDVQQYQRLFFSA